MLEAVLYAAEAVIGASVLIGVLAANAHWWVKERIAEYHRLEAEARAASVRLDSLNFNIYMDEQMSLGPPPAGPYRESARSCEGRSCDGERG